MRWATPKPPQTIVEPTNASRVVLKKLLDKSGMQHIIGKGYYAFINVGEFIKAKGWADSEPLGQYLAEEHRRGGCARRLLLALRRRLDPLLVCHACRAHARRIRATVSGLKA